MRADRVAHGATAELHRFYERTGFAQTGERALPEDLNRTREYRFERPVR